jgi:hypothetical protein
VSAWLRSLALAHIVADAANPPPMMGDGRDAA